MAPISNPMWTAAASRRRSSRCSLEGSSLRSISRITGASINDPRLAGHRVLPGQSRTPGRFDAKALHQVNRKALARVFWEERAFMSSPRLRQTFALRMCVINHSTTWGDGPLGVSVGGRRLPELTGGGRSYGQSRRARKPARDGARKAGTSCTDDSPHW